jgi:hypothetical protein
MDISDDDEIIITGYGFTAPSTGSTSKRESGRAYTDAFACYPNQTWNTIPIRPKPSIAPSGTLKRAAKSELGQLTPKRPRGDQATLEFKPITPRPRAKAPPPPDAEVIEVCDLPNYLSIC